MTESKTRETGRHGAKKVEDDGRVLLVGVPNCGKSALFCSLTGGHARVGNWAGVTVEKKEGRIRGTHLTLVDTPGICGLTPTRDEEQVTTRALAERGYRLVLQVVDGQAPERSFRLTRELLASGVPLMLAVSRADLYEARGTKLNCDGVSRALGIPVYPVSGRDGRGVHALREGISSAVKSENRAEESLGVSPYLTAPLREILKEKQPARADTPARLSTILTGGMRHTYSLGLDRILLASRWGYLFAFGILAALLVLTSLAFSLFARLWEPLTAWVCAGLTALLTRLGTGEFLAGFLSLGVARSVLTALSFLVPLWCFYLMTAALEDWGYLARISFLFDRALARVGLAGGAVLPLILSFGCGVTGISACRTLTGREKRACGGFCTYFPCHAKLPVIACVVGYCGFGAWGTLVLFLVPCLIGLVAVVICACGGQTYPLPEEIPPLAAPSPRVVFRSAFWRAREFVLRAGGIIALSGALIWLLSHLGGGFRPASVGESYLAEIGRVLSPVFAPLGFASPAAIAATLTGLIAKENAVITLSLLGGTSVLGTPAQAISFCLFQLLSPPCVAAMAQMRRTLGRRFLLFLVAQLLIAFFVCSLCYRLLGG
ncbi:MAG: FeoB small GTPase domain-containing protein [Eubacteriales bacterium]